MTHYMKLNVVPFQLIKNKEKTIELRLNDEKRQLIKVNDTIEFSNANLIEDRLLVKVLKIYKFNTFEELYKELSLIKCGYKASEVAQATPNDMLEYYSLEKQNQHGVLGIEFELIK